MEASNVKNGILHSQNLQSELQKIGSKIKYHEENLKILTVQINKLDESILDMHVTLGKYHISDPASEERKSADPLQGGQERNLENILQQGKDAAGLVCMALAHYGPQVSKLPAIKDVLGVVATLGKVKDDNLSRLLSEYLGLETMRAIVCKTSEGVKALEEYDKAGIIKKNAGLHGLGPSIGRSFDGRFLVICLEDLSPYPGDYVSGDPQKRLALLKPKQANGETPDGFVGFAVNMIDLKESHLSCVTNHGHGLRETLFYFIFSRLQMYKSRDTMQRALPYITDGAISLDGGIIKKKGMFCLGDRGDMPVRFSISTREPSVPQHIIETRQQLCLTKWKKERMVEDMQREETLLSHEKNLFSVKKQELLKHLTESARYHSQVQGHGVIGSQ